MVFEKWLLPDLVLPDFRSVTPALLRRIGITALLCDIDNTLATYDDADAPAAVEEWCRELQAAGIRLAFVSNNHRRRVERFGAPLGVSLFPDSRKPSRHGLRAAMTALSVTREETAVLGDQLFTDVLSAKRAGLYTLVVPPIKDKTNWFFRCKRWLEKPYMRRYRALHGEER